MIKSINNLKKEAEEDILRKPTTARKMALEAVLSTYGGTSYKKMPIEQLKTGCRLVLAARLKQEDVVEIMSSLEHMKTPEAIFTWVTEEIFK